MHGTHLADQYSENHYCTCADAKWSSAGRQKTLASHVALSYVSVFAYTGSLIGPALVGFGSEIIGLSLVFSVIAIGLLSIVILNHLTADPSEVQQSEEIVAPLQNETPA